MTILSKKLAFEASLNAVQYLLNRKDLTLEERNKIQRIAEDMGEVVYPRSPDCICLIAARFGGPTLPEVTCPVHHK